MWTLAVESVKPGAAARRVDLFGLTFERFSGRSATCFNAEQIVGLNRPLGRP